MPYFQDKLGALYFLDDADIANGGEGLLPHDCKQISDAKAQKVVVANKPISIDVDWTEKLRAFIAANPEVAKLIGGNPV